jgi:hypothetical protein
MSDLVDALRMAHRSLHRASASELCGQAANKIEADAKVIAALRDENKRYHAALKQIANDIQRDGFSRNIAGAALIGYRNNEQTAGEK